MIRCPSLASDKRRQFGGGLGRAGSSLGEVIFPSQASQATLSLQKIPEGQRHHHGQGSIWGNHSGGTEPPGQWSACFDRRGKEGEGRGNRRLGPSSMDRPPILPTASNRRYTARTLTVSRVCRPRPTPARGNLSDSESCVQGWRFASGSRGSSRIKLRPHCDALLHLDHLLLPRELFREIARRMR